MKDPLVTLAAAPLAPAATSATAALELRIEAEVDQGVTNRLLDLLAMHDRMPRRLNLVRDGRTMTLTMTLPPSEGPNGRLLTRMRELAGVRHAEELTAA